MEMTQVEMTSVMMIKLLIQLNQLLLLRLRMKIGEMR